MCRSSHSCFENLCALHALTIGKQHAQKLRSMFVRGVVLADEIMDRLNKNSDAMDDHVFWLETSKIMWVMVLKYHFLFQLGMTTHRVSSIHISPMPRPEAEPDILEVPATCPGEAVESLEADVITPTEPEEDVPSHGPLKDTNK